MSAELLAYSDKIEHLNIKEYSFFSQAILTLIKTHNTYLLIINRNNDLIQLLLYEKSKLQSKLSDSRMNSKINKENLMLLINSAYNQENYFNQNENQNNNIIHNNKNILVNYIIKENDSLLEQISNLFKKKNTKEKELINIFHKTNLRFKWEREKITTHNNEIVYMNAKLLEKDEYIETLEKEINKQVLNCYQYNKKICVNDPKLTNIEFINEITCSRDIINKLTEIYQREKISNSKVDEELNVILNLIIYFSFFVFS